MKKTVKNNKNLISYCYFNSLFSAKRNVIQFATVIIFTHLNTYLNDMYTQTLKQTKYRSVCSRLSAGKMTDVLTWLTLLLALLESSGNVCFCVYCGVFLYGGELFWTSFIVPFGDPLPWKQTNMTWEKRAYITYSKKKIQNIINT